MTGRSEPHRYSRRNVVIPIIELARTAAHESHRPYGTAFFGVALSQALRARLRSHRPSGTSQQALAAIESGTSN